MAKAILETKEGSQTAGRRGLALEFAAFSKNKRFIEPVAVYCLFAILVCAFTWPLVAGLSRSVPPHWDPRMIAWNMASSAKRLITNPLLLFHGNDFYPYGTTKAFSEILLIPSLFGMPIFLLSGNPILSYNITLLVLWSLSGLTMYLCAREIVGHRWGAILAATIWTLSPYRTDYYAEFNMQMCFAVPLTVLYWYRFLQTQRMRDAVLACVFLGIQALSCWNYAIMVSLYAIVFSASYVLLKLRGWKVKKLLEVIPIIMLFCVVMFPFARPYFQTRKELGVERSLSEAAAHSADALTYVESGAIRWYHFSPAQHHAETSLFPGFVGLLSLAVSCGYLFRREAQLGQSRGARIGRLMAAGGLLFSLLQLGMRAGTASETHRFLHPMHFSTASGWVIAFSLLLLGLRGWRRSKMEVQERALCDKEVLMTFLFVSFTMFLLSLGPVVYVGRHAVGHGPYYALYGTVFPLHAVRVVTRFGGFALFSMSIVSALGIKWVDSAVGQRWKLIRGLARGAFLLAAIEYSPKGLKYEKFHWERRPPVYDFVASDPGDFAIAEWPLGWREKDGDSLLWSVAHNKRILGGTCRWARKMPPRTERIAMKLGDLPKPECTADSMTELRAIYPTKYLIVHRRTLPERMWRPWEAVIQNPPEGLRLLRVYDDGDWVFAITPVVERGREFSREFSFEYVLTHNVARFKLRDASQAPEGRLVKVYFNDTLLCEDALMPDWKQYEFKLSRPYRKVAPNCIRIVSMPEDGNESQMEFSRFCL